MLDARLDQFQAVDFRDKFPGKPDQPRQFREVHPFFPGKKLAAEWVSRFMIHGVSRLRNDASFFRRPVSFMTPGG
jgi:hypothetical protein